MSSKLIALLGLLALLISSEVASAGRELAAVDPSKKTKGDAAKEQVGYGGYPGGGGNGGYGGYPGGGGNGGYPGGGNGGYPGGGGNGGYPGGGGNGGYHGGGGNGGYGGFPGGGGGTPGRCC